MNYVVPWLIIGFEVVATICLRLMLCFRRTRVCDINLFGIVPDEKSRSASVLLYYT